MGAPFASGAAVAARALGYRGLADLITGGHVRLPEKDPALASGRARAVLFLVRKPSNS